MSTATAAPTVSPLQRYHEIRALQNWHLEQAEAMGDRGGIADAHNAEFDRLQAEKEQLKAAGTRRELSDPWRTAIHEASHAVALKAVGLDATSLTIAPTLTEDGSCGIPLDILALDKAVMCYAGAAAEVLFFGSARGGTDASDVALAELSLTAYSHLHLEAVQRARKIVNRNSQVIQTLAAVLYERKTMSGQEVFNVLRGQVC